MYFIGWLRTRDGRTRRSGRASKGRVRRTSVQLQPLSWPPKFTQTRVFKHRCPVLCVYIFTYCAYICAYTNIYSISLYLYSLQTFTYTPFTVPHSLFSPANCGETLRTGHTTFHIRRLPTREQHSTPVAAGSTLIPEFFPLRTRRLAEAQTNKDMDVIRISRRNFPRYLTLRRDNNGLRSSRRVSWCTNKQLTTYARSPSTRADRHVVRQSGNHFCG